MAENNIDSIVMPNGEEQEITAIVMPNGDEYTFSGGVTPTGNIDITQAGVTDVTNYATATVPESDASAAIPSTRYITENGQRKWRLSYSAYAESAGWVDEGPFGEEQVYKYNAVPANTSVTPTESAQTIGGANYMMEGAVTVNAIPSNYVGSGVARKSDSDLWGDYDDGAYMIGGGAGYYQYPFYKTVPNGTEGTPTATKGAVSNHAVTVTPSVTNTAGYILGGTKTGTGVSVSASELVSGTLNVTSSGTKDVTNYASASIPAGGATASATKGTVTNHSVTVTPSVTRTAGYVTAGTESGTAVSVSASELVSGSETKTANGTYDVTNLAEIVVDVQGGGGSGMQVATKTTTLATAAASISFSGLNGEPTSFVITTASDLATGASPWKTAAVTYDGTNLHGQIVTNTSNAQASHSTSFSKSYSNGTLTVTGSGTNFQANQYRLVYTYGGNSANLGTDDVQVGSGATSISFTGLTAEPDYFSVIFTSDFSTSSGYQRVMAVVYDGNSTYGVAMDSGAKVLSSWSYTYSNGTLTVSSQGTNNGGYFHQPGYYQLTYGYGGTVEPVEIDVQPLSVNQNGTYNAPDGVAYSPVIVNVSSGGGANIDTKTVTNSSNTATSLQFTQMKGQPVAFFLRCTSQIQSSGSTSYYYVDNMRYNGTNTQGTYVRIGSTRGIYPDTTHYSYSYSGTTMTITSTGSRTGAGGSFYNSTYELVYIY